MKAPLTLSGTGMFCSPLPHTMRIPSSITSAAPNVSSRPYSAFLPYVRRTQALEPHPHDADHDRRDERAQTVAQRKGQPAVAVVRLHEPAPD